MTKRPSPEPTGSPDAAAPTAPAVEVDVARTGGIAGVTRRWSAQPPEAEASEWISLIDRCPWDDANGSRAPAARNPMPDAFMWRIRATWSGTGPRQAELPDDEVIGAWRELVDAVREWSRAGSGPGASGR